MESRAEEPAVVLDGVLKARTSDGDAASLHLCYRWGCRCRCGKGFGVCKIHFKLTGYAEVMVCSRDHWSYTLMSLEEDWRTVVAW